MHPLALIPAGLCLVASVYGLARYAYGLFLPNIQDDLGLSTEVMGFIASGAYASYLVATVFASWISGIVGPRLPLVLGGGAAAGGMLVISQASDPWTLGAGVMLAGTSPGFATPPLADAVTQLIVREKQSRTWAIINSGTSLGVMLSGPAALLAGADWRIVWAGFALFAVVATVWTGLLVPGRSEGKTTAFPVPRLSWRWFLNARSRRLILAAAAFGLATSVYWTFAVDLLIRHGTLPEAQTRLFWVLIGVFGVLGGIAGDLVGRFGLRLTFRISMLTSALSLVMIAVAPQELIAAFISAMTFGATFILITGLFGIWSVNIFSDRPSAGMGATFFLISAGQFVGPSISGIIAGSYGLTAAFNIAAVTCLAGALLAPRRDIHSMSGDTATPRGCDTQLRH